MSETIRCHCNDCGRVTQHDVITTKRVEFVDDETGFWWNELWSMLQCRGCESICTACDYEDATGNEVRYFYPPLLSRRAPQWSTRLPKGMRELLTEVYGALQNDSARLAMMGTRTLVDMLMQETVGDKGTFAERLAALHRKGVISTRSAEVLQVALDAGHAAAHRGFKPEPAQLDAVMDIVENLLESTYHLDRLAADLRTKIPPRVPPNVG